MNTSASCGRDPSLASRFVEIEKWGAGIGVFLNFIGIFYFFKESLRLHSNLKFILLNVHTWLALSDLIAAFFLVPDFLLPLPAFYPLGMFSRLGIPTRIQLLLSVTVYGGTGAAIQHLFFIRYQSVLPSDHPRRCTKKMKVIISVFFYILFGTYGVPLFFAIPLDQTTAKFVESATAACIPSELWEERTVVFDRDRFSFLLFYTIGYLVIWTLLAFCLIFESFYVVNTRLVYSATTRGLIRNSFKSVIAQLVSSFFFLIIPILLFIIAHFFFLIPQQYGYILVFFFSMHSAFGKITIAIFSQHFRGFLRARLIKAALYLLAVPDRRTMQNQHRNNHRN